MTRASFRFVALFTAIGLCCALSPAFAQQHAQTAAQNDVGLGFKGIGGSLGLVDPENASSAAENSHTPPRASFRGVTR